MTYDDVIIDVNKLSAYFTHKIITKYYHKVGVPVDYQDFYFAASDYANSIAQLNCQYYYPVDDGFMHIMHINDVDYDLDTHKLTVDYGDYTPDTPQIAFYMTLDNNKFEVGSYDGKKAKFPDNYDKLIVADFALDNTNS